MKRLLIIVLLALSIGNAYAAADLSSLKADPTVEKDGTILLNNGVCPVTGEATVREGASKFQGVVYRYCCPMCSAILEKDPQKYALSELDVKAIREKAL